MGCSKHPRNVGPMMHSARCGARTRAGGACQAPAVSGRRRCRMHGGSIGSGAPKGNQNALKSGLYTGPMQALRRDEAAVLRAARSVLREDKTET